MSHSTWIRDRFPKTVSLHKEKLIPKTDLINHSTDQNPPIHRRYCSINCVASSRPESPLIPHPKLSIDFVESSRPRAPSVTFPLRIFTSPSAKKTIPEQFRLPPSSLSLPPSINQYSCTREFAGELARNVGRFYRRLVSLEYMTLRSPVNGSAHQQISNDNKRGN